MQTKTNEPPIPSTTHPTLCPMPLATAMHQSKSCLFQHSRLSEVIQHVLQSETESPQQPNSTTQIPSFGVSPCPPSAPVMTSRGTDFRSSCVRDQAMTDMQARRNLEVCSKRLRLVGGGGGGSGREPPRIVEPWSKLLWPRMVHGYGSLPASQGVL